MPIDTAYVKIMRMGRRSHKVKNTPILTIHELPVDYPDLESTLADICRLVYFHHDKQTLCEISIERHLAGRYRMGMVNYRDSRIRTNRMPELFAKVLYNHRTDNIKIKSISFASPEFFFRYKDGYDAKMNKKWELKPVNPQSILPELINPESKFHKNLAIKTPNYDLMPIGVYSSFEERHETIGSYPSIPHGIYGSANDSTVEQDKSERQSRIRD